jgi:hypothetical protein
VRSRINVFEHNKKIENRIKSREAIVKEEFGGKSGEALVEEVNKRMAMAYIMDNDFKKKYIEFGKDSVILGSKYVDDAVNKYAPINGIKQTYDDIRPMFNFVNNISNHLKSKQTGNELILNAIELNNGMNYSKISTKANMSVTSLNKAYDNFKKSEEFFVFDTETLSGMGKTGYNELDRLQEIAFRKFKKVDGKLVEDEASRVETLIGITQKQYDEYMDIFVNNFNENGWQGNQKYEVIAGRFAKLGHKDTVIKNAGKGLAITESFASDASENLMDVSNIKRGLERALEIGKRQDAERLSNGLMVWEDQLLRSVKIFNENFVAGFNSTNFDFEKMNQSIGTVWNSMNSTQKAEYSKILNLKNGTVPVINPIEGNYLDFRDVVRTAAESIGKTGIYGNDNEKLKTIKGIGKTLLQQESLGEVFAKDAMFTAAHTAGADVTTLAHLMGGKELNGASLFDELMTTINKNASALTGKVDYNSVLMATQGEFFNDFTRKGALNFTTDRSSGAIRTFNGMSLDANGDVRDLGKFGKATGLKKNVAYKIGFMGEMDMSEDWIKKMSGIHQDYAQGKLWVAKFNPLIDKTIAGDNSILEDPTTYFFTSKEAMEGFVSSHFAHVGNIGTDGKIEDLADPAARAEVQKLFGVHTIKDGKVSEAATQTASELVSNGTIQAMNDPAARMIRENEYTKAIKFQRMQDYLKKNGATTIDEQKKMLSLATAENVAGGKTLKIKHDVLSILGFQDKEVNKQVLYSSTLNNTINSYGYMASKRNVIDSLVEAVKEYGNIGSEQQQFIYDSLMRGLREDAANAIASGDLEKEALINGSSELKVYAKDLDYFEFDMPEGYFKNTNAKAMPGEIDNVLRVNLKSEKEYSLVNDLLRRRRGNDDRLKSPNARQAYGMQELRNFANTVNSLEEYKGIFDDILYGKPVNELKNLANLKKYEKSLLKDELYSSFDNVVNNIVNNNEEVIESRASLEQLRKRRIELQNFINENNGKRNSLRPELEVLSNEFKNTILPDDQWQSLLPDDKRIIKEKQKDIMLKQKELLSTFDNSDLFTELSEIESNMEEQYNHLFNVLDISRSNAKTSLKEMFSTKINNKNKEIDEVFNKLNEVISTVPIEADISVDAMSEKLIQAMKNFRENNPSSGFSKDRVIQNVLDSDELLSTLDDDFVKKSIENTKSNLPNLKLIDVNNKNEVKSYAEEIVDSILMPTVKDSDGNLLKNIDDIATFAQKTYGYNETTTKLFKYNLQMQREEHVKGISDLVTAVGRKNGFITYDKSTSELGMRIGGETYNLWGMPKTRIENGTLFIANGQGNFASGFKLDVQDAIDGKRLNRGKVAIKSDLADSYKELRSLNYRLDRAAARGDDLGKTVIGAVSNVASKVRELSALGSMTTKDSYAWQGMDLSEGILSMPYMLDEIKSYDGWQDDDFIKILERNKNRILNGNITSEVQEAYAKNKQDVVKMLLGIGAGNENKQRTVQEFIAGNISNYTKDGKLAVGRAMVGEYSPMAMTEWDNPSRPPISSADEILFNKKKLDDIINDPTKGLKGRIETGSRIVSTRQGAGRKFDGIGEVATGVTFKNANISEKKFKEIISDKFEEELEKVNPNSSRAEWLESLRRQMSGLNLTEQGKLIDGRVADALLSETETQRINTFKNFSRDMKNNTKIMNDRIKKAMPTIEIAQSGEIVFKLGKKDYVKRGDALFAIDGYGDVLDTIGVKEDAGLFGFGYNSKGSNLAVGEDEISKLLNKNKNRILNADGTINQDKAMRLLNESFDSGFYVKNAFVKGYNKGTIEYAEKGMYDALVSGAGTLDNRVDKLLEAVGMKEASGKVLSEDFIDLIAEKYSGLTAKQRSDLGFAGGWNQVKNAINKEKFAKTDFIREIDAFKDIVAFTNDNVIKHGNAGIAMKGLINNITEKYMIDDKLSFEEASKKTVDILNKEIIIDKSTGEKGKIFNGVDISFKDGKIHIGEIKDTLNATIDKYAVQALTDELGLYDKNSPFAIRDKNGNVVGYTTTLTTSFNEDFSGTSRSSIEKDKIKKNLDNKKEKLRALNPETDSVSYNALNEEIKNLEHSYRAAKNYDKTMTISSRETDMMSLYEYDESKMAKVREKLGGDYNKIYKRMLDEDGRINSEYTGRAIHQGFLDDIEDKAFEQAVENKKYFDSAKNAITYNNRPGLGTDFIKDNNFEEVKIGDLVIPNGHDTKFLESDPNRSFGRNLLVDTGLSGNDRYVAISANNYSITGDDVNTDEVQKSLAKLQRASKTLEDGRKGINGALDNGTTVKDLEARVRNAADELKESVVGSMRKTLGGLDSVQLGGYSYEKATMAMLDPDSLKKAMENGNFDKKAWNGYKMYGVSKINGKTLGEWASQGVHYDASWHGKQYFKDLGYFDKAVWKDKYKMKSVDEMIEYLRVNGTAGIELRTPTIKEGSMSVTRQYLDTDLKDGQAKATASLVFGRNQDHDGDSVIQAELRHKDWTLADYEIGMKNNPNNVPEDVKKYYEELNAAQTYRASTINNKIYENVAVPTYNDDVKNALKNANVNKVLASEKVNLNGRYITPFSQAETDTALRNDYLKKYGEIEESLISKLGKEKYKSLNVIERAKEIDTHIAGLADDVKDGYRTAARFVEIYEKDMSAVMSKVAGKASIGYINTPLASLRRAAAVEGFSGDQRKYIQAAADILEQNIISKKHSTDYAISLAQTFRSSLNDMFEGKISGANNVNRLIRENYSGAMVEKLKIFNDIDFSGVDDEEILNRITSTISDVGRAASNNSNFRNIIKAENAKNSLTASNMEDVLSGISERSTGHNKSLARAKYNGGSTSSVNASIDMDGFESSAKKVISSASEVIDDMARSVGGSGLAKAALGIAGAIMAAGYIGGNPTIAPGTEAQDLDSYDSLQDKDLSIQQLPQGTGQGYVININAQSARGQDHAIKAIQQAMQSSVTTDINIAMNVNDKTNTINSRYIDKLLSGAI